MWFGAAVLVYIFTVLPLLAFWLIRFEGYDFNTLRPAWTLPAFAVGATLAALITGRYAASVAEAEIRKTSKAIPAQLLRMEVFTDYIALGRGVMLYGNPVGLAFALCVRVLWRRMLVPTGFLFFAIYLAFSNLSLDAEK